MMDISLIINEIKFHLGIKTDSEFASFLGTTQSNIATWKKRNTINYELIIAKCPDIDANYLFSGKGPMLRSNKKIVEEYHEAYDPSKNIKTEDDGYKEKYILLLERYNLLLEDKIKEYIKYVD